MLTLPADIGVSMHGRMRTDSTASVGICKRQGLGKVRHLQVQDLRIQQRVRAGNLELPHDEEKGDEHDLCGQAAPGEARLREPNAEEQEQEHAAECALLIQRAPDHGSAWRRRRPPRGLLDGLGPAQRSR